MLGWLRGKLVGWLVDDDDILESYRVVVRIDGSVVVYMSFAELVGRCFLFDGASWRDSFHDMGVSDHVDGVRVNFFKDGGI